MSNLSYRRMENTFNDLQDCFDNWEETASESELKYRQKILELCCEIIESYEENTKFVGENK